MRILLIGGYGFIGSAIARGLLDAGHHVTGFGRSISTGQRLLPDVRWLAGDLGALRSAADWRPCLEGVDAVINASGILQGGGGERIGVIQGDSICALIDACEAAGIGRFIQISAPGATADDASPFLSTKAQADDRLRASRLRRAILRPGLVIGRNAYGGTLLVRALAAMPVIAFSVHGRRQIQTVAMDDVVAAVLACLRADADGAIDVDLIERQGQSLAALIAIHRSWLGIAPARFAVDLPAWAACGPALLADALGQLGWRSPLRSTAMAMIARDVTGDPAGGEALLGRPLATVTQTLERHPSGMQDRWQARLVLLTPLIVGALALLFLLSGIVGLARIDRVAAELDRTIVAGPIAHALGVAGSLADIALGAALLVRRRARAAALGMAVLTLGYLVAGSILRPDYWIDPLAPLAKAACVLVLAMIAHALLEER